MVLLVRFGEIALKSRFVRRQLRDRLVANIQDLFAAEGVESITESDEARVYVHADHIEKARSILSRVFGVVSMSPATEVHADLASLRDAVVSEAAIALSPGATFALRTRRVGTHPFTSQDLARELGDEIRQANPESRVNLSPDGRVHELVKIARADAVFLGTRWSAFDADTRGGLNVPVFEPVIGLTDDEVGHLASRIESA